jgi:hypothetical protein
MKLSTRAHQHVLGLAVSIDASSLVLSVHRGTDVPPDKVLGIDMPTGSPNEKKKDCSKNKQPKSQPTPAVRQVHVVLWDDPPKGDPQEDDTAQEDDTDYEPDHV